MNLRHKLLSLIILACIGMQLSTFATGTRVWPFMAYCMYSESFSPPSKTRVRHVVVVFEDTSSRDVVPADVGKWWFSWERHYMIPIYKGNQAVIAEVVDRLSTAAGQRVVRLETRTEIHAITESGYVETSETKVVYETEAAK